MKYERLSDYIALIEKAVDMPLGKTNWVKAKHYGEIALTKLPHLSYSPAEEYLLFKLLGRAYLATAEYSRSLNLFYKAYLTATKHHFKPADVAYASLMMLDNFVNLRYFKQAFVQFQKVERYYQKYGTNTPPMDERKYISTYLTICYYYLYQKELKKVREIIEKRLLPRQATLDKGFFPLDYQHLKGEYLIALKDYPPAAQCFRECIKEGKRANFPRGILEAKIHLAIIELLGHRVGAGIVILRSIMKDARAHKLTDLTCEAGIFLSKCYLIAGMPERAKAVETGIKPFLNQLDTVWLYEKSREVEELFRPFPVTPETPLARAPDVLTSAVNERYQTSPYKNIVGKSNAMQEVYQLLEKIAPTDLPVLLQGETGTGKELIAAALHQNSPRRRKSFLAFNCGAIPETLIESHLFGHTKGAFTDATESKKGYIELTYGGTLLIDEIANMPLSMQQKLLRVLEEQVLWPVGADKPIPVDTRFIFASNQNIEELVRNKLFREDLFYRINTIVITLPPLRERGEDILLLVNYFLDKNAKNHQPKIATAEVLDVFLKYYWPGNVRELGNELKKICTLHPDVKLIKKEMLSESIRNFRTTIFPRNDKGTTLKELTADYHRNIITETLAKCNGNFSQAARLLGYDRNNLYKKMKQLKMSFRRPVIGERISLPAVKSRSVY